MTDGLPAEVAALREAVDSLADRVALRPKHRLPDRLWTDRSTGEKLAEWDVQGTPDNWGRRLLAVRAGRPEGIPGVFLVDADRDMFALTIADARRLIEVLTAGVAHAVDDLAERRVRRET